MPLTETGFQRRTFAEILEAKIAKAKELFGEDIDTSELTPLGKFIRINAYDQALTEEETELVYYSIFPNTAQGVSLDRLCVFAGISRNATINTLYKVEFTGTAGTVIPVGFLIGTESGINFATTEDVTIGESGTIEANARCEESGEIGNVKASDITVIVNPVADVESVTGIEIVTKGAEAESDYELRKRFNASKEGLGSCNEVAITSALLRIPTVTHAGIIVNDSDVTDDSGRPPKSFECFIHGGEDYHAKIAETIFDKKPLGIKTHGTITEEVIDSGGHSHSINFSHTATVSVYVRLAVKTDATFEGATGKKAIKSNLEDYIDSVGIGNTVVLSSLYGYIHGVTGVKEVSELLLSTDGNTWNTANITVEQYENCICQQVAIKQNSEGDYEVI